VTFNCCSNEPVINGFNRGILEVIGSIDALHIKSKGELSVATIIVNYEAVLIVWILNIELGIALHVWARKNIAAIFILIDSHGLEIGIAPNAKELIGGHWITENHVDRVGIKISLDRV
jgi:hypothetical protein